MATMMVGRKGEHRLGEPPILRYDLEVSKLRPLTRAEIVWIWDYYKNDEIDSSKLNYINKDILISLLHAGYLIKKRKFIYTFSEVGYLYYKKLKDKADLWARGIDVLDKPLLLSLEYFSKLTWFRGYFDPTRVIFSDLRIVIRANKVLSTVYATKDQYPKLKEETTAIIRQQVDHICDNIRNAHCVKLYKFQRRNFLKPGIVWFKEEFSGMVFPLSEVYFDYLYIHSGKMITEDSVYVVKKDKLNLFGFFSDRFNSRLTLKNNLIAYAAGLNTTSEGIA